MTPVLSPRLILPIALAALLSAPVAPSAGERAPELRNLRGDIVCEWLEGRADEARTRADHDMQARLRLFAMLAYLYTDCGHESLRDELRAVMRTIPSME